MLTFAKRLAAALITIALGTGGLWATPTKEAPWLPEAAAYRLTLHLGNLVPVDWDAMADAWRDPYRGSEISTGALDWLASKSKLDTGALTTALAAEDRQAVFSAATRLIALRIEEELDRSLAPDSANPLAAIATARELYRAFADHIRAADPAAARAIGIAWLDLNSAAGSAGVLGAGVADADRDRMLAARAVISDYLKPNYIDPAFAPRPTLTAIPESIALSGADIYLPPSYPPGTDIFDQDPLPRLVLNFEEQGIDEADLPLIAYGDMLFDSAQIFGEPARSLGLACSTCHNRSDINNRLFLPGASHQPGAIDVDGSFFNPIFNDRRADPIDTPSLRGLRFTGPYGRDGRFGSIRNFTRNVIVNEFAGPEPTPFMLDALVAYMTEFDFLPNSMLNADGSLTDSAPDAARRGEVIFNTPFAGLGNQSCSTCHQQSANFLDRKAHDIGSATPPYEGARSGAFDTPTLLGTLYTAPYFHDGALPTLASVVDWFNDTKSMGLSAAERSDLTAYLETVGAADEPYETFDDRATPFRLAFEELTTFASTLNTLLPARDATHILLLTDTVATDLAADASTMSNLSARPDIYRMARLLDAVGAAVRSEDWTGAEASWDAFQELQTRIDESAY